MFIFGVLELFRYSFLFDKLLYIIYITCLRPKIRLIALNEISPVSELYSNTAEFGQSFCSTSQTIAINTNNNTKQKARI